MVYRITIHLPEHPQAIGQVKVTNLIIIQSIKMRLTTAKGLWVEELRTNHLVGLPHDTPRFNRQNTFLAHIRVRGSGPDQDQLSTL